MCYLTVTSSTLNVPQQMVAYNPSGSGCICVNLHILHSTRHTVESGNEGQRCCRALYERWVLRGLQQLEADAREDRRLEQLHQPVDLRTRGLAS